MQNQASLIFKIALNGILALAFDRARRELPESSGIIDLSLLALPSDFACCGLELLVVLLVCCLRARSLARLLVPLSQCSCQRYHALQLSRAFRSLLARTNYHFRSLASIRILIIFIVYVWSRIVLE